MGRSGITTPCHTRKCGQDVGVIDTVWLPGQRNNRRDSQWPDPWQAGTGTLGPAGRGSWVVHESVCVRRRAGQFQCCPFLPTFFLSIPYTAQNLALPKLNNIFTNLSTVSLGADSQPSPYVHQCAFWTSIIRARVAAASVALHPASLRRQTTHNGEF